MACLVSWGPNASSLGTEQALGFASRLGQFRKLFSFSVVELGAQQCAQAGGAGIFTGGSLA